MSRPSERIIRAEQYAPANRKPYHAPCLEDYGEVRELTRTSSFAGTLQPDGGTDFPYVYSSTVG